MKPPHQWSFVSRQFTCLLLPVLALLLLGCSGREDPGASVSGLVTLEGKPVPAGSILLISESGAAASAPLDQAGSYSLRCAPGEYLIAISPPPGPDPLGIPKVQPEDIIAVEIPKRYRDTSSSGEQAKIAPGQNTVNIEMVTKPK